MIEELVPVGLRERVKPLLPSRPPRRDRRPGWLPTEDRAALAGIVFVLKTGITWRELPREVAGCAGVTCWRRLRDWTEAGVFAAVHELLLDQLRVSRRWHELRNTSRVGAVYQFRHAQLCDHFARNSATQ